MNPCDFVTVFRKNEKAMIVGALLASGGLTVTIQANPVPTVTIYDQNGLPVNDFANVVVTGYDNTANITSPTVWFLWDTTAAAVVPGVYEAVFTVTVAGSDGSTRVMTPTVGVKVTNQLGAETYDRPVSGIDLLIELIAMGMIPNPPTAGWRFLDAHAAAAQGMAEVANLTGREFLASTTPTVKVFDPPTNAKGCMSLHSDLCSTEPIVVQVSGITQTVNKDYFLGPEGIEPRPYSFIEFMRSFPKGWWNSARKSVTVSGVWGFSTIIPADVWRAMLSSGLRQMQAQLSFAIVQGLVSWHAMDMSQEFDSDPLAVQVKQWDADSRYILASYTKRTGWL